MSNGCRKLARISLVAAGMIFLAAQIGETQLTSTKVTGGGQIVLTDTPVNCGDGLPATPIEIESLHADDVTASRGTFGFNARLLPGAIPDPDGVAANGVGHLNYVDHAQGIHLNCTVTTVVELGLIVAKFKGRCSSNKFPGYTDFSACAEDHGEPAVFDEFEITTVPVVVNGFPVVVNGGPATIRNGNIQIHPPQ